MGGSPAGKRLPAVAAAAASTIAATTAAIAATSAVELLLPALAHPPYIVYVISHRYLAGRSEEELGPAGNTRSLVVAYVFNKETGGWLPCW